MNAKALMATPWAGGASVFGIGLCPLSGNFLVPVRLRARESNKGQRHDRFVSGFTAIDHMRGKSNRLTSGSAIELSSETSHWCSMQRLCTGLWSE
ncbi:hypothetical protein FOC4_g10011607 [Fusarium odoratissimum]|uniref:Uncharacterized protein n=2 Tax=Fusarium oxysporum species complex TaxID=171631 RepID=N1R5X4_FUSC4|nr:hypothetical protein FOC4_g10011607 [Fusarium odoratissimum]TXC11028.1 hypothetical protein FocTR4_00006794 [Fusarium oxysporum f. sp. cubense]